MSKYPAIIVMKVGPHSGMSLQEILISKQEEEKVNQVHYWGYSGVFCMPQSVHKFCEWAKMTYGEFPKLVLLETSSSYKSKEVGFITKFSTNNKDFYEFKAPVQLQGAQFAFVAKNIREYNSFCLDDYIVYGGKNDGKKLSDHLRYRVNKAFAVKNNNQVSTCQQLHALIVDLVEPFAIWLKEN